MGRPPAKQRRDAPEFLSNLHLLLEETPSFQLIVNLLPQSLELFTVIRKVNSSEESQHQHQKHKDLTAQRRVRLVLVMRHSVRVTPLPGKFFFGLIQREGVLPPLFFFFCDDYKKKRRYYGGVLGASGASVA